MSQGSPFSPYVPNTQDDRRAMLAAIGVESVDDLFADIPEGYGKPTLDLPAPLSELELRRELQALSELKPRPRQSALLPRRRRLRPLRARGREPRSSAGESLPPRTRRTSRRSARARSRPYSSSSR